MFTLFWCSFTSAEVCIDGQKASAVLYTLNGIFIHQAMIVISSSNMNFPLNLERKVNLNVLSVSRSEPLMSFATVAGFGSAATTYTGSACEQLCGRAREIDVHMSLCGCCRLRTKLKTTNGIMHVILDTCTRPSRFSACNIEKLGVAWRRSYLAYA